MSHWVTPKIEKKRYTTRFFIAQAPQNQEAVHDGKESINSLWIKPEDALKEMERKDNFINYANNKKSRDDMWF